MKENDEVKIFITFGSDALPELKHVLNPMKVMLVLYGKDHWDARAKLKDSFIGNNFCTSYSYADHAESWKAEHGMKEYTLEELEYLAGVLN